jgi:hypothetical protein
LLYNNLITQGGYAPISGDASEGDQYYVLAEGASALSPMLAFGGGAIMDSINSAFRDWQLAGPDRPPFGEWFRSAQHSG